MGGLPINSLDFIFGVILIVTLVMGLYRGFVREVASILGLLLAFFLAGKLYAPLVPLINKLFTDPGTAALVSYILAFIGISLIIFVITSLLRTMLGINLLGWLDRLAGSVLGFIKGSLICAILLIIITTFLGEDSETLTKSKISPQLGKLTGSLSGLLPASLKEEFRERGAAMEEIWEKDWAEEIRKKNK